MRTALACLVALVLPQVGARAQWYGVNVLEASLTCGYHSSSHQCDLSGDWDAYCEPANSGWHVTRGVMWLWRVYDYYTEGTAGAHIPAGHIEQCMGSQELGTLAWNEWQRGELSWGWRSWASLWTEDPAAPGQSHAATARWQVLGMLYARPDAGGEEVRVASCEYWLEAGGWDGVAGPQP